MKVYRKGPIELRCGDYREVLADVEPDAVITDPPYSERTHGKQCHGRRGRKSANDGLWCTTRGLGYASWSADSVAAFLARWGGVSGWLVAFSDDVLSREWRELAAEVGRTTFAPLACLVPGMNVRLAGDGPANWTTWANVSRPRALASWGALPGGYICSPGRGVERATLPVAGAKPLDLMRSIVRDYSRPGDLVCDPCAGGATTLIAAALEGRRAIGAELDPDTFEKACARIERTALTPPLRGLDIEAVKMEQTGLGFGKGDDK